MSCSARASTSFLSTYTWQSLLAGVGCTFGEEAESFPGIVLEVHHPQNQMSVGSTYRSIYSRSHLDVSDSSFHKDVPSVLVDSTALPDENDATPPPQTATCHNPTAQLVNGHQFMITVQQADICNFSLYL